MSIKTCLKGNFCSIYPSRHEYASGYYRVLPYFIAKVFIDVLVFRLIPNFIFATVIYFMIGKLYANRYMLHIRETTTEWESTMHS